MAKERDPGIKLLFHVGCFGVIPLNKKFIWFPIQKKNHWTLVLVFLGPFYFDSPRQLDPGKEKKNSIPLRVPA